MSTTIVIIILITIYVISIFGGIEMLVYTKENVDNPSAGIVFIPILNTIMAVLVLVLKLIDAVMNFVNHRIDYNERNKFKNERL
jgi:hypothetical protein